MTNRRTHFDPSGLVLDGTMRVPFYAAGLAYWNTARADWASALRGLHDAGFTVVSSSVPWRRHASEGFGGELDLPGFLAAAHAAGLHVALRIGPSTGIEQPCFGLPDRVLADDAMRAVTSRGTPAWLPAPPRAFPIPSYASAAFQAAVGEWYGQLARVIDGHEAVVALGIDHHAQMFHRLGAFDLDYHPDALAWFREATGYDDAPRAWDPADRARCLAWVTFKDHYIARALGGFAAALAETTLGGLARTHALPPGDHALVDRRAIATAIGGVVGTAAHADRSRLRSLRHHGLAVAGTSTVPLVLETRPAVSPWLPPLDLHEKGTTRAQDELLTLLASGARGFVLEDPSPAWIAPLLAALGEIEWTSLRRAVPVALVGVRADLRFGIATNVIDPVTPAVAELLQLGPGGAAELGTDGDAPLAARWFAAITAALELAQVPFVIVDETTPEPELAAYRAIIAPTLQRIDRGLWQRLRAIAEARQAIVVIGPTTPTHDELGEPLPSDAPPRRIGKIRDGSLDDLPGLAQDLAGLVTLADTWQIERPDSVRAFAFADGDTVTAVILANDAPSPVTAVLLAEGASLHDPLARETIGVADGKASVTLAARGVRLLLRR